ncbi:hypothetical protein BLX90_23355 (plasmid) [Rhizobium sp. Y9]|nr:hypothetical protein BLX90_23355 [Rhizobium sp. Y9]
MRDRDDLSKDCRRTAQIFEGRHYADQQSHTSGVSQRVASSYLFKAKSIQLAPISLLNETGNLTSEDANVFSFPLSRLPVLPYVVADLLAIGQGSTEAYSRDVDEHIRSTIIRSDEAKPLILSEEFYGTSCHLYPL